MKLIRLIFALYIAWIISNAARPVHAATDISALASSDHEIAYIIKAGTLLATFEGDDRAAAVTVDYRFRDGELWHSHVYPGTPDLSPDDLFVARQLNLKKMCAVSIEATCCATRVGRSWKPISRATAQRMTAEIYYFFKGRDRVTQIAWQHAYIAADAVQRGYDYACW